MDNVRPEWGVCLNRQDVAGLRFVVVMQLYAASIELPEDAFNPRIHRSVVGSVAGHEFLDDCSKGGGR